MTQFLAESIYVQGIEAGNTLSSDNKVDIIFVNDRYFKKWANYGFISDLKRYTYGDIYNEKLNKMWSSIYPRFRYNRNGNTSYEDDPLWGVPVDTSPTAIYYNRQAMENVGIIVISVADEIVTEANFAQLAIEYTGLTADMKGKNLMDLWNENKISDKFGQYHDTCGNRDNEEKKYQLSGTTTGAGYAADILAQPDEYAGTSKLFVPKKGYYRQDSFNNFIVSDEINSSATVWVNPNENGINDIVKVFNASIEMNWDELEDLARLLSMAQNKVSHNRKDANGRNVATTYGFYTEWWNNYVWSVGGDCLQDLTGEGTWAYGLADWSTNYLVTDNALDKTDENGNKYYLGVNTGTHYKAGDTLKYLDKLNVKAFEPKVDEFGRYEKDEDGNIVFNDGDLLIPAWNGGMRVYDAKTGKESDVIGGSPKKYTSDASIRLEIKNNATTDISANPTAKFIALPSSKSAMNRYLGCIGKYLGIMPTTRGAQSGFDTIAQFGDGKIAMVVERGYEIGRLREFTKANDIEWGVAPLPRYKEYKNPQSNDTIVKAQGVYGGHSEATALCITKTSKNADNAWKVIDWLTSDIMIVNGEEERAGQYYKAVAGYIPNQPDIADNSNFINEDEKTLNLDIFFDMLEYEKANEWWYLSDNAWIDTWANPLNNQVRNNEMTAETWFNNYNIVSCRKLIDYSYYFGSDVYKSIYTQSLQRA